MNRKQRRASQAGSGAVGRGAVADARFVAAVGHHREERLRDALTDYARVSPLSPAYADALRLGGQVALRLGEAKQAAAMLGRAADLLPADARVHYNLGIALKQSGRLADAAAPFRRAAELDAADAEAPANLGATLAALGDHAAALEAFAEALRRRPGHPAVLSNLGLSLAGLGRDDEALAVLAQALAAAPGHRDARVNLAATLRRAGRIDEAIETLRAALADGAEDALLLAHLGAALQAADRVDEAVEAFRRAAAAAPGDAAGHYSLGTALYDRGDLPGAVAALREAIRLRPGFGEAWDNLGIALQASGEAEEAVRAHRRAADLMPDDTDGLFNLGTALHAAEREDEARDAYRRCLARDPAHAGARHMLAALAGGAAETAPESYVENLFDSYARWFDDHLVHGLGYRTPGLMRDLFDRLAAAGTVAAGPFRRGLDLGCGTGLAAQAFRDRVRHLAGVDLSRRMVAESRRKGLYDDLAAAEMVSWLRGAAAGEPFDLVLAADALVYLGDLAPLFAAIAARTGPGAVFLFSVERLADGDYRLGGAGRFAHGAAYLRRLADETGFAVAAVEEAELRRDHDRPVIGLLAALVRTA